MIMMNRLGKFFLFCCLTFFVVGCQEETPKDPNENGDTVENSSEPVRGDWVRIHIPSDPDGLHPYLTTHASATQIKEHLFQVMCDFHPGKLQSIPVMAKEMPTVSEDGLNYTFEVREEAAWDNGDPITGEDYAFSVKAMLNPLSEASHLLPYYSFIKNIEVDPENPRKFTVLTDSPFFLAGPSIAGFDIISRKFYDPDNLLGQFEFKDMIERPEELRKNEDLIAFNEHFFSEDYRRNPEFIYGSGPYKIESWTSGDNISLVRKENWWGDKVKDGGYGFVAYPEKIIYKTIPDRNTALKAAVAGEIDIMASIPSADFMDARENNATLKENFHFHTPETYSMILLGMNARPPAGRTPFLEDKRVRKAINMLANVDSMISIVYSGFGTRVIGPVSPHRPAEYNSNIEPIPFDPAQAAVLLDEAGWIDTDGNGIRDKEIKGKRVDFEIDFMVSTSSKTAGRTANMLAREAKKVGLIIDVKKSEFGTLTGRMKEHQFDMYGAGFSASPLPTDLRQAWHTEAWVNRGSNYVGFGTEEADSLIDLMRVTIDPKERTPLYHRFQEIIQEECPSVFIMAPKERMLIHKRFQNAEPTVVRPGFKATVFWTPKEKQKF